MTIEIKFKFGPISGTYKKQADAPDIINPCQHLIIPKDKMLQKDTMTTIHGDEYGDIRLKHKKLGENK